MVKSTYLLLYVYGDEQEDIYEFYAYSYEQAYLFAARLCQEKGWRPTRLEETVKSFYEAVC